MASPPPPPSSGLRPGSTRCGNHPDVAAVDTCSRCGTFLCGDCVEYLGETVLCDACYQRLGGDQPGSRSARTAVILGGIGAALPLLLAAYSLAVRGIPIVESAFALLISLGMGFAGFGLARSELRRIQAGRAPIRGQRLARAGLILSAVNFGLFFLGLAAVAAFFFFPLLRG